MHQSMPCSVASAAMQTDCTSTNVRPGDITFNYTNPHLGIQSLDLLSRGCQLRRPVQKMRQSECLQRHSRWALHPRSSTLTFASHLYVSCKCSYIAQHSSSLAEGVSGKVKYRLHGRRAGHMACLGDHLEHAEQLRPVLALPASAVHKGQVGQAPPTRRGAASAVEAVCMLIGP